VELIETGTPTSAMAESILPQLSFKGTPRDLGHHRPEGGDSDIRADRLKEFVQEFSCIRVEDRERSPKRPVLDLPLPPAEECAGTDAKAFSELYPGLAAAAEPSSGFDGGAASLGQRSRRIFFCLLAVQGTKSASSSRIFANRRSSSSFDTCS
jgi:hypothetical protein